MDEWILGVHAGHNSSAVIANGKGIVFGIQEERLSREKNHWGFPHQAVQHCLHQAGIEADDLSTVAVGRLQQVMRPHTRSDVLKSFARHQNLWGRMRQRFLMPAVMRMAPTWGQRGLRTALRQAGILPTTPLRFWQHHRSHATTAYYGLRHDPHQPYLVITADGSGDGLSSSARIMGGGQERVICEAPVADSLGALYAWVTFVCGFVPFEHEYKLMGMAAYASEAAAQEHAQIFADFLAFDGDDLVFRRRTRSRIANHSDALFEALRGKRFDHICAGLQLFTEEMLAQWVAGLVRRTGVASVLAGGGVFMNVKANQRIAALPEVESFEAFPSCGDETLPFGAVWSCQAENNASDLNVAPMEHFYWGDNICEVEARAAASTSGCTFWRPSHMAEAVAELLAEGHPVARCSGAMEFGARALGNRSILADPKAYRVVGQINRMVKKRDFWMPFAPMMRAQESATYIKNPKKLRSPYMMMTFDAQENYPEFVAAVHNADQTCRAQMLERDQNTDMDDILQAFKQKTGRGVVLNTSFNMHGSPIVRTAQDALDVFLNTGLRHLQVGPYLVSKDA